ncbi:hypothetical protein BUALT_Bualt13G0089100 [Buddleja alternifolia]|uniref:DUF641 domain-containing protein n=1 Tax=Buddleja alternifolia TaxID=168488 RepID=A0AAV6WWX2_9LAMI|nr:hypothetical protein BUALT_Bualt13G0089100 [Buddleja alternifolia]
MEVLRIDLTNLNFDYENHKANLGDVQMSFRDIINKVNAICNSLKSSGGLSIKRSMASKVSNFSDLIQRVTASCLLHPLAGVSRPDDSEEDEYETDAAEEEEEEFKINTNWECTHQTDEEEEPPPRVMELEMLMGQVFDAVSTMKRAYVSLQEAHCPWDPDRMRVSDVAVVAELRRIGLLRERFRRSGGGGKWRMGAATLREVVAPPSPRDELAAQLELILAQNSRDVSDTQPREQNIIIKVKSRVHLSLFGRIRFAKETFAAAPAVELFEATMGLVKEASKAFTSLLLSLMRSARWDIAAAVRSIEAASSTTTNTTFTDSIVGANHAKYALESYINRKIFQGFDHETFYMDGSLSSILHPDQHRTDCFTQYRDMKAMDPMELLSILPTCSFGKFCFKKYLSIVHPKMEESLFGDLEQRRQVLDGHHPRSQFYGEFLGLAKAVWLLHLLAFSLDPPPSHFEASRGAEFHSQYMESVVRVSGNGGGAKVGMSMAVGFPVGPGFKLGNGSIIKARVYLIPKN